jgi:hypothetical protein
MHRGRALRDGFATQAAARLYIHRSLIAPAQLMREPTLSRLRRQIISAALAIRAP